MADYKADKISGWQRAKKVTIVNEYGEIPRMHFTEEIIVNADTTIVKKDVGEIVETFSDPSVTFPLISPIDDSVIGEATYGQVYAILYSLYRDLANKRDNR